MAEPVLSPITALGARAPRVDRIGTVTITERPEVALASLALRRGTEAERLELPITLPGPGGHVSDTAAAAADGEGGWGALWLGPGSWLIEAPLALGRDLSVDLARRVAGRASVTDQTDAWVCFDIDASDAAALFERLCMLDVRRMDRGAGSRSVIEHVSCLVICREANRRFTVIGPRSAAASLHHALTTAAAALEILGTP